MIPSQSRFALTALLTAGLCLGAPTVANAAVVTAYTNVASWSAAVTGTVVVEDFATATLLPGFSIRFGTNSPAGSIAGGVYDDFASTQFNDLRNPLWRFASTNAFGADFDLAPGGRGAGLVLAVLFGDGTTSTQSIANPVGGTFSGFLGLISNSPIASVRFDSPGTGVEEFSADNLRFVAPGGGTIPEPASLALVGIALAAAFGTRCKLRRT